MKKLFSSLFLTVFLVLLASCGGGEAETPKKNDDATVINKIENLSDYVFVDMQSTNTTVNDVIKDLEDSIKSATGIKLKRQVAFKKSDYEILVGTTNREESINAAKGLGRNDYTIGKINNKIVIVGGSDEALLEAVKLFKSQFVDAEAKSIYLPEKYTYVFHYPVEKLSVEGTPISEFKVYTGKSFIKESFVKEALSMTFDFEIEVTEEMTEDGHYIILDATSFKYEDYSIAVENGNIVIHGSARSVEGALKDFGDKFLRPLGAKEYDLTSANKLEGKIEKKDIYTKEQLMQVITEVYEDEDHIIIGEQGRGMPNCVASAIATFEKATGGHKPGILGFDFSTTPGGILTQEYGGDYQAKKSLMICEMLEYVADGGIITFSAHWPNPSGNYPDEDNLYRGVLGYDYSKAAFERAFTDLLTEGTKYNEFFNALLEEEAEFFLALQENGVPALWRPLHETNGNWFWFCTTMAGVTLDSSYIRDIWYYVYNYFESKGIDNLLWVYAPSPSDNFEDKPGATMSPLYLYPGDEYCDIVGVDWYTEGDLELLDSGAYLKLIDHAGKPGALTEFGASGAALGEDGTADPELYSSMNVYRDLMELKEEGHSFSYLMTWGGSWSFGQMGEGEKFMNEEMTWGQAEVKMLFDQMK